MHLMPARAGHQRDSQVPGAGCRVRWRGDLVQLVDQRVPDIRHRHAVLAVERLLEGEDHQHVVDDFGDLLHPAAAPGPHLRGDVIQHLHAELVTARCHAQVELRIVDEHHRVRPFLLDARDQLVEHAAEEAEMPQDVEQPHDGHLPGVVQQLHAFLRQQIAADPERRERRIERLQLVDDLGGVEVTGSFSCDDRELHARSEGRRQKADVGLSR